MELKGYRTYITSICLFFIGLSAYIDPKAASFVSEFLEGIGIDVSVPTILMICALIFGGLRKVTKTSS